MFSHLTVGAGGKPQQISHQLLVNAPVLTSFHCQFPQLIKQNRFEVKNCKILLLSKE